MGAVMIICPATGLRLSTGIKAEGATFRCSPVFFADTYCPNCEANHRWFAREAWIENQQLDDRARAAERA